MPHASAVLDALPSLEGSEHLQQLELSAERFHALAAATSDGLYRMSADWSEMCQLHSRGFIANTETPNRNWLQEYVPAEDQPMVLEAIAEAIRTGGNFELEHRVLRVDGSLGWTCSRVVPLLKQDGSIREWFGVAADITERKLTQDALNYQSLQFQTLLNEAPIGVCLVDRHLRIQAVNPVAMEVFAAVHGVMGLDFAEVIPLLWSADYADEVVAQLRLTLETGESYFTAERHERLPDLDQIERYEWQITRIVLPDGSYGVVCYFKDISQAMRSKQVLEEADRRKDEFLATLAHELRTPLGPLRNCLQVLRMNNQAAANGVQPGQAAVADQDSLLAMMEHQVQHMVRLVDDLMEVSRITRGEIGLRCEPLVLQEALAHAVGNSRQLIEGAGHRLELDIPTDPLPLHADRVRMTQIFSNLLNNAAKYTSAGGRILVQVRQQDGNAVVRISDNGPGIPTQSLSTIFDMFIQGEHTRAHAVGGLGIGLTLVRNLVELHGGSIEARSEGLGRGSEFVVRLPMLAQPETPQSAIGSTDTNQGHTRSILVIDDSHENADSLAMFLEMAGHQVRIAYDGSTGVQLASALLPEIVLLDLGMPGMTGFETCCRLRALPDGPHVLIVAVTGWGQKGDRLRTADCGFDLHLVKPIDPRAMLQLLDGPVEGRLITG